jgi:predicted enzyme related to lactoylglutathione lyase
MKDNQSEISSSKIDHLFAHGQLSYVQIPAVDVAESAKFYEAVFSWQVQEGSQDHVSFTDATGNMIGAWITDLAISREPGVLPYVYVHGIDEILEHINVNGGKVIKAVYPEGDVWVATFSDPGYIISVEQLAGQGFI